MIDIIVLAVVCVATVVLTGVLRRSALQAGVLDVPNARSSHSIPTPRGGGLAICAVTLIDVLYLILVRSLPPLFATAVMVGGVAIAGIGYRDDRVGVSASVRFLFHALTASAVLAAIGGPWSLVIGGQTVATGLFATAIAVVGFVWWINLFNFMDGIDGIAAGEAIFILVSASSLMALATGSFHGAAQLPAMIAMSSLGFLVWNWPPARIFLGDSGSGYLGFMIGAIALFSIHQEWMSVGQWLMLTATFLADATATLVRRLVRGERPHTAHRSHAYQLIARRLSSHRSSTLVFMLVNVLWCLPWCIFVRNRPSAEAWAIPAALFPLFAVAWAVGAGGRADD